MLTKILKQAIVGSATARPKLALVVRSDIKMSKGKTAAQCAHAAVICYQQSTNTTDASARQRQHLDAWCRTGQAKIVLRVETHAEMLKLQAAAQEAGVQAALVHDAGHTQLEPGTATVLGVGPDAPQQIDKLVGHLKLL